MRGSRFSDLSVAPAIIATYEETPSTAKILWEPTPFQRRVLGRLEFEVFLGGGKFSGKTDVSRAVLVQGNPHLPWEHPDGAPHLINRSYIYHPNYYATIIRKNQKDLDQFIHECIQPYAALGGRFTSGAFQFPSGARIVCGHLDDKDAWEKYTGVNNIRFIIEEAGLIPSLEQFLQVRANCRSVYPELRPQIFLTANFIGPGMSWLIDRYVKVRDAEGRIILPETTIYEETTNPFTKERLTITRVFMFSTVRDNPHAAKDPNYIANLATMDERSKRIYLHGDWDAAGGNYFYNWRVKPGMGEPPHARHVITSSEVPIPYYCPLTTAMDWGHTHECATLWARRTPEGRVVINDEYVVSQTEPELIGFTYAQRTRPVLEQLPSHSCTLWLSPDAFDDEAGGKSIAHQIAHGIARVLGPRSIYLPDLLIRQLRKAYQDRSYLPGQAQEQEQAEKMILAEKRMGITIRMAINARVAGWNLMRDWLRWERIGSDPEPFDPELAEKLLQESPEKFEHYHRAYRNIQIEPRPKLLVTDNCVRLIDAIPKLQSAWQPGETRTGINPEDASKQHFTGLDVDDAARYLCAGINDESIEEPLEAFRDRHMAQIAASNPGLSITSRIYNNIILEQRWKDEHGSRSLSLPRKARLARRPQLLEKANNRILGPIRPTGGDG